MDEIIHKEESYEIVGAAMTVYNELGFGFLEKVYERALAYELVDRGFRVDAQKPIQVYFRDRIVGDYYCDLIVNNQILLELKSGENIPKTAITQVVNYLKATRLKLGIILNFAPNDLQYKRVVL